MKRKYLKRTLLYSSILTGLCISVLNAFFFQEYRVQSAIELLYFRANPGDEIIVLQWATATEIDTAGFYILKSNSQTTGFSRISPFIFSKGDSLTGSDYEYEDRAVENGVSYWYKLEEIDTNQRSTLHGPITTMAGESTSTPSATKTPTKTSTLTVTNSPTVTSVVKSVVYKTPTSTPIPRQPEIPDPVFQDSPTSTIENVGDTIFTSGEYPYPPSDEDLVFTEVQTATYQAGQQQLLPFPSVDIQFPTRIASETLTIPDMRPAVGDVNIDYPKFDETGVFWVGFISLLWLLLLLRFIRVIRNISN